MTKRREFLVYCGALSAGLMLAPGTLLANVIPRSVKLGPGHSSIKEHFRPLVNSKLSLTNNSGARSGWVNLVEIKDFPSSDGMEQFSLVFRNTGGIDIQEGLYQIESPKAKPYLIYMHPLPSRAGNQRFVSYFSILV